MQTLMSALKNEHTKRILRATGIRPAAGYATLGEIGFDGRFDYGVIGSVVNLAARLCDRAGPDQILVSQRAVLAAGEIARYEEVGKIELKGFWEYGQADLQGVWTDNARKCPALVRWIESTGGRFGRVQLLRMSPNTLRECRWGLHLDNNNQGNPESSGWIVRVWLELTDDPASMLVIRPAEFDRKAEIRIPLPRYQQVVLDSEALYHGGYHAGQ